MAAVNEWNMEAFAEATASGVAMADFYAVWCGPCKSMMSVLEKVAGSFSDEAVKIGKVNIEECPELTKKFQVRTVPTFIVFKDGEVQTRLVGVTTQAALTDALRKAMQ